ncbi:hypothetical protein P4493_06075 [Bacillus thuringiensis]|uniref:Uncharacterized protein n=3 Tax=Bacillus thuringiensis TaxID=1428 RepID=A0A0B5NCF8_BACTU|nr:MULTISPECIES: hypothetical protein [Bacillus]EAO53432.1 hypothetical protein RBTH_04823 [Bacillus thuringiensis serovar israelensis ATCC 35646]MEC2533131.1 hypothetical protein [Bacillus cereus]MED1153889.1 hypothetical protein [Bacillus paranthracis]OUB09264.1 hypothetical protein BK708_32550 [Bacillus thuringiensis serovar yunnanensis]AFQ30197.1 hypothetical protein BTF1_30482 [Bacillus thuringiensis HD-789]
MNNRRPVIFNKDGLVALGYIVEVKGETLSIRILDAYNPNSVTLIDIPVVDTIEIKKDKLYELDVIQEDGYLVLGSYIRSTELGETKHIRKEDKEAQNIKLMRGEDVYINLFLLRERVIGLERVKDIEWGKKVYEEVDKIQRSRLGL